MRRPLLDTGWGPERAATYARRRRSYVTSSPLQLDDSGLHAMVRLDFPRSTAGKGAARVDAARAIAAAYGVLARSVAREPLALTVRGAAEDVARFVDGLPRVIDHAEQLASWVARMHGDWTRRPGNEFFAAMDERGRRAHARDFRAAAFRVIVAVLVGPEGAVLPEVDPARPVWEQVEAFAGGVGQYGWLEIHEAYDPAEALQLLDSAHEAPAARWTVEDAHGEQLALFPEQLQPAAGPVVVIPCSGAKLPHKAPAGRLYTGKLHTRARKTADALTANGGTVLVLSALHGFLPLTQVIEPYDHTWEDAGSITVDQLRAQALQLGLADADDVVLLTPSRYTSRAAAIWPDARTPLAHLGIGKQLGRLASLRTEPGQYSTAA
jgi:hypothetical protein